MDIESEENAQWNNDSTCGTFRGLYESDNCTLSQFVIPGPTVPHMHDFDEIYFVLKGSALMRIGEREQRVYPRDRIFIPRNTVHQIVPYESDRRLELVVLTDSKFDRSLIVEKPDYYSH